MDWFARLMWGEGGPDCIQYRSPADRLKVEPQLEKCGFMPYFKDRIFSGHEMPRSKPAPDVYLAAAAALGVDPKRCAVVEDTVPGVTAGVAAGVTVFGYSPPEAGHDAPRPRAPQGNPGSLQNWTKWTFCRKMDETIAWLTNGTVLFNRCQTALWTASESFRRCARGD